MFLLEETLAAVPPVFATICPEGLEIWGPEKWGEKDLMAQGAIQKALEI